MAEDFDGKEIQETPSSENDKKDGEKIIRAKLPRGREVIGLIDSRLGGNKMMVACLDGLNRNCRVPGRLKRKLWLRPRDVVIVEPWELDNKKGDVVYKYNPSQVLWLRKNGYLKEESNGF